MAADRREIRHTDPPSVALQPARRYVRRRRLSDSNRPDLDAKRHPLGHHPGVRQVDATAFDYYEMGEAWRATAPVFTAA